MTSKIRIGIIDYTLIFSIVASSIVRNPYSYHVIILSSILIVIYNAVVRNISTACDARHVFIFVFALCLSVNSVTAIYVDVDSFAKSTFLFMTLIFAIPLVSLVLFYSKSNIILLVEYSMFASLSIISLIGVMEILFNFDMIAIRGLESQSSIYWRLVNDRFLATSIYINYNNFIFALSIYSALIIGRVVHNKKLKIKPNLNIVYSILFFIIFLYQIYVSSRAGVLSMIVIYIIYLYIMYRDNFNIEKILSILLLFIVPFVILVVSGVYLLPSRLVNFYDGSFFERWQIYIDSINVMTSKLFDFFFGFGYSEKFYNEMHDLCGYECLANPHNVMIEIFYTYGFIAFSLLSIIYLYIIFQLIFREVSLSGYGCVVSFVIFPIAGLGPSEALDFYFHWWILIAAICSVGRHDSHVKRNKRVGAPPSENRPPHLRPSTL